MAYKYVPEKEEPEYTERIKSIIKAHEDVGFEWTPDPDRDSETVREIAYIRWTKRNPGSAKQELLSVYREKDDFSEEEYMLWKVKYSCLDKDDRPFEAEVWLGKVPVLDTVPIKDPETGNTINKRVTRWNMKYVQKWDPKKFAEILRDFNSRNAKFYLSSTSEDFFQNFGGSSVMIKDRKMYESKTYEELMAYDEDLKNKNNQKEAIKKVQTQTR